MIANNVFLGSNGENMIDPTMMALYHDGKVDELTFSGINMSTDFAEYIKGGIKKTIFVKKAKLVNIVV